MRSINFIVHRRRHKAQISRQHHSFRSKRERQSTTPTNNHNSINNVLLFKNQKTKTKNIIVIIIVIIQIPQPSNISEMFMERSTSPRRFSFDIDFDIIRCHFLIVISTSSHDYSSLQCVSIGHQSS
jgi:hypothetical protein